MDHLQSPSANKSKWLFEDYKRIKLIGWDNRVAFQRKGKYTRGCTITEKAFESMDDVSLISDMKIELEKNVFLINQGKRIILIKYCMTRDGKQCEGGFFQFTPKEWQYFWTTMYGKIKEKLIE